MTVHARVGPDRRSIEVEVVTVAGGTVDVARVGGAHGTARSGRTLSLAARGEEPPVLVLESDGYALVTRAELVLP